MSARWRVTWTRERHKKKPRKRDGRLDLDAATRGATLYDERERDDGTISFEVVARERLPAKTWDALESGAEIALGGVGVYLDEVVDRGGVGEGAGGGGGDEGGDEGGERGAREATSTRESGVSEKVRAADAEASEDARADGGE